MSFTFTIAAPERPDYQAILFGVNLEEVECLDEDEEGSPLEGPWPDGVLRFHRPGFSTRGVEVFWEDQQFGVRIHTLSSPEDYDLALRFIESAAVILGGLVQPEDSEPLPVEELRGKYDDDWVRLTNEAGVMTIRSILESDEGQTMSMMGTYRPVYVGAAVVEELDEAGPPEEFQDRLLDVMRQVQNIDPDDFFFAEAMEIAKTDEPDKTVTVAAWSPDTAYLFPDVDYLVLIDEEEKPMFIPYDALTDVLEEGWVYIDERQTLVDAISLEEWPTILRKAAEFAETPLED